MNWRCLFGKHYWEAVGSYDVKVTDSVTGLQDRGKVVFLQCLRCGKIVAHGLTRTRVVLLNSREAIREFGGPQIVCGQIDSAEATRHHA